MISNSLANKSETLIPITEDVIDSKQTLPSSYYLIENIEVYLFRFHEVFVLILRSIALLIGKISNLEDPVMTVFSLVNISKTAW